jgi:hypothetical protein
MTRLGPGWRCQPKVPPGAIVFCSTWRSELFLVWIRDFQNLVGVPGLMSVLALASISAKRPTPRMVVVTPEGGVACAGSMSSAAATRPTTAAMAAMAPRMGGRWRFIAPPVRSGRWSAGLTRQTTRFDRLRRDVGLVAPGLSDLALGGRSPGALVGHLSVGGGAGAGKGDCRQRARDHQGASALGDRCLRSIN